MKSKKLLAMTFIMMAMVGCSIFEDNRSSQRDSASASEAVVKNAVLAIEHCGKGNVRKVTTADFSCKK